MTPLKKGDAVTVILWNGSIVKAEVIEPETDRFTKRFIVHSETHRGGVVEHRLSYLDEGAEWCRGHEGEDVEALLAAEAMADRTQPTGPRLR